MRASNVAAAVTEAIILSLFHTRPPSPPAGVVGRRFTGMPTNGPPQGDHPWTVFIFGLPERFDLELALILYWLKVGGISYILTGA